jgi:NAD-reducing hydrogenase large subunit
MAKTITIDPVSRIEGHAKITLKLDDAGKVNQARFHVTQMRGFEKFCEGRPFPEMPSITARTCGICPVSHLVAGSKACDALMGITISETAAQLRRLMNLAQLTQSHALSFFHLSSPDMLLGWDSDPKKRNIFGMIVTHPELAKDGIRLRQIGQSIIELLGGKKIHAPWMVPGGVNDPLTKEKKEIILKWLPEAKTIAIQTLNLYKKMLKNLNEEIGSFGNFPSLYMGMVNEEGNLEHYDGRLRIIDETGKILQDKIPLKDYAKYIGEAVEDFSYMKFPYYKELGYPKGMYRVGPLARLNVCTKAGTKQADVELSEFRSMQKGPISSSFHYHYARLIEIVFCIEKMQEILELPYILDPRVRSRGGANNSEGVGVSEAPRGTLVHHYKTDENGNITWCNLVIATGHNNLAINKGVLQVAQYYVDGNKLEEGMLNRVEAIVRCYDPCLSCATHALGQMPLHIQLVSPKGELIDEVKRS